mgnify:FL=1
MTDRELLELAAKAAGISWKPAETDAGKMCELKFGLWLNIVQEPTESTRRRFNPLNDDGDALRLAVDLRMLVDIRYRSPGAIRYNSVTYWVDPLLGQVIEFGDMETCLRAATRRAIVRAAAELAKQEVKV